MFIATYTSINNDLCIQFKLALGPQAIKKKQRITRLDTNGYDICTIPPKFTTRLYSEILIAAGRELGAQERLRLNKMLNANARRALMRLHIARNLQTPAHLHREPLTFAILS